jgi:hypothetical protein
MNFISVLFKKNPRNVSGILIIFLLILFQFQGCFLEEKSPCSPSTTYTQNFSKVDSSCIPYNGLDTLIFIRTNLGDTQIFNGFGRQFGFNRGISVPNGDCLANSADLAYCLIEFKSKNFNDPIKYYAFIKNYLDPPLMTLTFRGNKTFTTDLSIANFKTHYADSLLIQNRMYYNVARISDDNHDSPDNYYILYNKNGILKIKLASEEWEIINEK